MTPLIKLSLFITGALTLTGLALGIGGTFLGMRAASQTLGSSGIGDPATFSTAIAGTLIATTIGIVFTAIGFLAFLGILIYWLCTRDSQARPPQIPTAQPPVLD